MTHNLNEEYLQSLTEEQRDEEMSQWTATEWQQYFCPNGTVSVDYFFEQLEKRVVEMVVEKYGREYDTLGDSPCPTPGQEDN